MKITIGMLGGVLAIGAGVVLVGCERADPRLENLHAGMPKDSVVAVMEGGPSRTDPYLYQGQYIEAMLYPRQGKTDTAGTTDRKMAPVIVINGILAGWGWPYWDSVAAANKIELSPEQK